VLCIDDNLSNLTEITRLVKAASNAIADLLNQEFIQRLLEDIIYVTMTLRKAIGELVILVCKVANVDATQRVCLRKGQCEGEWQAEKK
jgi:hypothetical protein